VSPAIQLPLQAVVTGELTLLGTCASNGEYPRAIELLRTGAIDVRPLITLVAPLEEGPALFDRLYAREPGLMKVVLQP
jgi:threonine dehydrogenase-like Zn-dependent dehydrogenase